jgi:uncharacterized protein (TIGR02145 family)
MFKYIKTIITTITVFIFLALAFGSGDSDEKVVINISDKQALEKYIQGKWSWEKHTGDVNMTWRYRFEIVGNTLRIWKCVNNTKDPFDMSEGYEELHFSLGEPTRDVDGYNARYLAFEVFDKSNFFGLTYESLAPFWLVSDDNWDTPVLRCASGIPSWSREEFSSVGNRINHKDWDEVSNSESSNYDNYEENNSNNTEYSDSNIDEETFIDNQIVKTNLPSIDIGNQQWTTQNLDVDRFINGDIISQSKNEKEWIDNFNKKTACWCYFLFDSKNKKYGKIYNWYAVFDPRGLAPSGWQIPNQNDWNNLVTYLGGEDFAGKKIKNKKTFNALIIGSLEYQSHWAKIIHAGYRTIWWSSDVTSRYYIKGNPTLHESTEGRLLVEGADYLTTNGLGQGDGGYIRLIQK